MAAADVPKRVLDIAVSAAALALLAPVLLIVALLVRWKLGSPVLFTQERAGLHGAPFRVHKFRTMTDARDASGALLPDEARLTPFGAKLRATTLDELPELWDVLRGKMSLVGPRPLPTRYLARYSPRQARRHEVKPGLTGWAVIHGRNALSWPARLELDVWYVENRSFLLDLRILAITVAKVLRREGINAEGQATMYEFEGGSTP